MNTKLINILNILFIFLIILIVSGTIKLSYLYDDKFFFTIGMVAVCMNIIVVACQYFCATKNKFLYGICSLYGSLMLFIAAICVEVQESMELIDGMERLVTTSVLADSAVFSLIFWGVSCVSLLVSLVKLRN